ncbi:Tyrosine-protein kinase [Parasponia andersonii]|uniref:Tyrosine-protein kinase n=1 Tax=Parasponia andersonii TaxID=3476 RepID=A0A2P5BD25_PARAD|nr:Tyrosine-protein kinase [Parasponia andersonii]
MALKITALVLLHFFIGSFCWSHATEDDVRCLKALKDSFEDPLGYLNSSWNFDHKIEGFICKFKGVECWRLDENKVLNIHLSNMGLKGNFPRGIKYCTSLTGLILSNNSLSGTIPSDIGRLLPFVTYLDLSNNDFSGEIPKGLANCTYLNVLKLDHNRLTGNMPEELRLLSRIKEFTVANNILSGQVPDFNTSDITSESYANNPQLCGGPLGPCHDEKWNNSFKIGFGTGFLVSAITVFLSFSGSWSKVEMILKIVRLKRNRRKEDDQLLQFPTLRHEKEIVQLEKTVNRVSFSELCKATDNFSMDNVIGEGKTGTMYKATFPNGRFLAVKRLDDSPHSESQFVSELLALSRMQHDNLIPLLGFCMVNNERLLVYKHMSNGNLYDRLHPGEGDAKILHWPLRVKIAMGIARGLAWLHHRCIFRVVHCRISSSSVLLDHYFEPKISNFGNTIMSNYGGEMFVYPNENDSGLLLNSGVWESDFVKKDVFDYGTVLLELITGKETITSSFSSLQSILIEWISSSCMVYDAIDKPLIGQGFDGEILEVLRTASDCVHPLPYERPTMLQVYKRISNIGERYGIPCDLGLYCDQEAANTGGEILEIETEHCCN